MAIHLTGADVDEINVAILAMLDAFEDGLWGRDDARLAFFDMIHAALSGQPALMKWIASSTPT